MQEFADSEMEMVDNNIIKLILLQWIRLRRFNGRFL
jgi:hypothetical protein